MGRNANKYDRLIANTIIFALGNLTVKAAQFFILPLLTKYLLASEYGVVENVISTVQDLLIPILTLGLAEALFRFSINKNNSPEEIITNSFFVVGIGILIFAVGDVILYFGASATGSEYGQTYFLLLIPLFAFKCIKNLLGEFTRGIGKSIIYALSSIIESMVMLATAAVLIVVAQIGIYGYLLALVAAPIVGIIFISIMVNPLKYIKIRKFNAEKLKVMLKYSTPNVSNSVCWWVVQTSSRYLVVYLSVWAVAGFTGSDALYEQAWSIAGIYTAASKLPALINVVSSIFLQAWSLSSAQESDKGDHNEFYGTVFKYYHPLIFLASACIMLIVPYVSKWLLQGEFYEGWVYSPFLIMGAVIGCFSAFYGAFFGAYFKSGYSLSTTVIGAAVNVVVCCVGIPLVAKFADMQNVVYVAVIAFFLSYVTIFISRVILAKKLVNVKVDWIKFSAEFMLNLVLAVLYTLDVPYKWIAALAVIIIILIVDRKEFGFIMKKALNMITLFASKLRHTQKSETPKSAEVLPDSSENNDGKNDSDDGENETTTED